MRFKHKEKNNVLACVTLQQVENNEWIHLLMQLTRSKLLLQLNLQFELTKWILIVFQF